MRLLTSFKSALLLAAVAHAGSTSAHSNDVSGLYALVKRRMPTHSNAFTFNLSTTPGSDLDTFTVRSASQNEGGVNVEIYIECTTINACARGLYTLVKFQLYAIRLVSIHHL
jgi:alpha-N-acetylglucosaminidase